MVSGDSRDQRGPHAPSLQAGTLSDTSPFSLGPGLAQAVATEMLLVPVPPRLTVHSAITPGALGNTPTARHWEGQVLSATLQPLTAQGKVCKCRCLKGWARDLRGQTGW